MASEGIFTTTPLELIIGTYSSSATAISTTASSGTAKTLSRGDHVHSIALATGDSNGQIKIAGQNVSVKGFSTAYLANTNKGSATRPIYITGNAAAETTYAMCNTNTVATTAQAITTKLPTGIWYVNGTNSTDLYSQADGALYCNKYNDSWMGEIYQDYRTGQIAIRGLNNGTWGAWRKVLDSSNYSTYCAEASHSHSYLPLAGGTMTGNITMSANTFVQKEGGSVNYIKGRDSALIKTTSYNGYGAILSAKTTDGSWEIGTYSSNTLRFIYSSDANYNNNTNTVINVNIDANGKLTAPSVANAIWNDYAEYRCSNCEDQYGRCVIDQDDGKMILANKRLLPGAKIISDTWGHTMGETKEAKTPIAVAGRVLVYPYKNRDKYHAGQCVCTAPNGTVDIMTRAEIITHPDAIIGIVSEIPNYETWGTGNVKVNGRIWIYIK